MKHFDSSSSVPACHQVLPVCSAFLRNASRAVLALLQTPRFLYLSPCCQTSLKHRSPALYPPLLLPPAPTHGTASLLMSPSCHLGAELKCLSHIYLQALLFRSTDLALSLVEPGHGRVSSEVPGEDTRFASEVCMGFWSQQDVEGVRRVRATARGNFLRMSLPTGQAWGSSDSLGELCKDIGAWPSTTSKPWGRAWWNGVALQLRWPRSSPVLQLWRAIQGWAAGCVLLKKREGKPGETRDLDFGDGASAWPLLVMRADSCTAAARWLAGLASDYLLLRRTHTGTRVGKRYVSCSGTTFRDLSYERHCISCELLPLRIFIFNIRCLNSSAPYRSFHLRLSYLSRKYFPKCVSSIFKRFSDLFLCNSHRHRKEQQSLFRLSSVSLKVTPAQVWPTEAPILLWSKDA